MISGLLLAAVLVTGPAQPGGAYGSSAEAGYVHLPHCLVSLIDQAEVPAQEPGLLVNIEAREGLQVAAGDRLAQIDDTQAQTAAQIAKIEWNKIQEEVKNDIEVRYAQAASRVAESEYLRSLEANKKHNGSITQSEIRRQLLEYRKSELAIEKADFDRTAIKFDADARKAELDKADSDVKRRQIASPLDGIVVDVLKHAGEWVEAGQPVFKVVGLDRLRVEGFVVASQHGPHQVDGRLVHVRVILEGGREEVFTGKIVFANPIVQDGEYRVWAEVQNRRDNDKWLLLPGHEVEMAIELDDPQRAPRLPAASVPMRDAPRLR